MSLAVRDDANARLARLFEALQRLIGIDFTELQPALDAAARLIAEALAADLVTVFLCDPTRECLVAVCATPSPMARRQRVTGLDRLPLVRGGLAVKVFQTGGCYLTGQTDQDPDARQDIQEIFQIRSAILCRLEVNGQARGVLQAVAARQDWFVEAELSFLEAATRWMGLAGRQSAQLEQLARDAAEESRRLAADQWGRLTPRAREVAMLIASGLTNEQIAGRLQVAPGTAANHVQRVLRRLGFARRIQVATWAAQHGFWADDSD